MAGGERRPKHADVLLIVALLLVAALLGLFILPLADCPTCKWNFFGPFEKWDIHKLEGLTQSCGTCNGRTRVSLFTRWRLDRNK